MIVYGIDFTSRPSPRKPITVARCTLEPGGILIFEELELLKNWDEFETFLDRKGKWIGGFDFPFGQPMAFLEFLKCPTDWPTYTKTLSGWKKTRFESRIAAYRKKQSTGSKEPLRMTDALAGSQSPLKLVNAPVAKMFFEGAPRLLQSSLSILPLRPTRDPRIAVETYPGILARRFVGTYKSDTPSKQTRQQKEARNSLINGILSSGFNREFHLNIEFRDDLKEQCVKDATGDKLDAFLCAIQAAWGWRQGRPNYGIPEINHPAVRSEGWIVDPYLARGKNQMSNKGNKPSKHRGAVGYSDFSGARHVENLMTQIKRLSDIGRALSGERDLNALLEMIIDQARGFTNADGGTLYIIEKNALHFKIVQNESLKIRMGGVTGQSISFPPIEMQQTNVSAYVAMTQKPVNIPDVYHYGPFDFTGPRKFDKMTGYRTKSMLVVPMKNHENKVIGVLQLLNARNPEDETKVIPFAEDYVHLVESLASQAAVAITHVALLENVKSANAELALARDKAMEHNRSKSQFLANMSHELRTPMNAIIGYGEMLLEETEERNLPDLHSDLEKITSSAKFLLGLINEILDLSKVEAGKIEIYLETFEIAPLIKEIITSIQPLLSKNKNELKVIMPEQIGSMTADITRVRQMIVNLLSNACKFTENGTLTLQLSREIREGNDWIIFSITDSGIGMTQEQMANLFKDFSQADSSTTRKYGGTGLGLAISKRFCLMMGGDITVKSEIGKGSTFTIHLPEKVIPFTAHPRRRASDQTR